MHAENGTSNDGIAFNDLERRGITRTFRNTIATRRLEERVPPRRGEDPYELWGVEVEDRDDHWLLQPIEHVRNGPHDIQLEGAVVSPSRFSGKTGEEELWIPESWFVTIEKPGTAAEVIWGKRFVIANDEFTGERVFYALDQIHDSEEGTGWRDISSDEKNALLNYLKALPHSDVLREVSL
ncbi:MAG: hypothetical protein M3N59_01750 [bacterium]|nr:hypothetical protein [bacterium]